MKTIKITYQTRRQGGKAGVGRGDWQDKEKVVVVDEDARDAVDEIVNNITGCDFRLIGVEMVGKIDVIAQGLR